MEANRCRGCGESVSEGAKFCPSCGIPQKFAPDSDVPESLTQNDPDCSASTIRHRYKFILGGIGCVVAVALLMVIIHPSNETSASLPSGYSNQADSTPPQVSDSSVRIETLLFTGGKDGLSVFFTNDGAPDSGILNVYCYDGSGKQMPTETIHVSNITEGLSLKSFDVDKNAANCGVSMGADPSSARVYYPTHGLGIGTVGWDPYGNLSVEFMNSGAPVSGTLRLGCVNDFGKQVEDKDVHFTGVGTGDSVHNFPANPAATRCSVQIEYADSNGIIPQQSRTADSPDLSDVQSESVSPAQGQAKSPNATMPEQSTAKVATGIPSVQPPTLSSEESSASSSSRSRRLNRDGLNALAGSDPDLSAARRDFEDAVKADSSNIEALNNLGWIDGRMGNYRLAKTILEKVLSLDPNRRVAQANLGYVLAKMGDVAGARSHFCRLIALSNSQSEAQKVLRGEDKDPDANVHAAVAQAIHDCLP